MDSHERWKNLWASIGAHSDAGKIWEKLVRLYSEPHRAYHTMTHIEDCLSQLDRAHELALNPGEIEIALWFHDAIYDTKAPGNEEQSALLAYRSLVEHGVAEITASRVSDLIVATKHDAPPAGRDAELLLDIDLSILGQPPDVFDLYEDRIRIEYEWVPEPDYRKARATILKTFLAGDTIYRTGFFRERYEAGARDNLQRSISRLLSS